MSDGMDFVVPPEPSVKIAIDDLERLNTASVSYWAKSGKWTVSQAVAILNGFVPLSGSEPEAEAKRYLLKAQTAPLLAELIRQSADPLAESLPPEQWLEKAEKCGKVYAPIKAALGIKSSVKPRQKTKPTEAIQAYVNERRDDIAQRQWQNFKLGIRDEKPTVRSVANKLLSEIKDEFGKLYKDEENIRRLYLGGWKIPKPE